MGKEIERKYKVKDDSYKRLTNGILYKQGYLSSSPDRVVRVRIIEDRGFLTIEGRTTGISRDEYEYEIPFQEAENMLMHLCEKPIIEKRRYKVVAGGALWEIDEFYGVNEGLIIAEIELQDENEVIEKPQWIGEEVTEDSRYYNSNLIKNPYTLWK